MCMACTLHCGAGGSLGSGPMVLRPLVVGGHQPIEALVERLAPSQVVEVVNVGVEAQAAWIH